MTNKIGFCMGTVLDEYFSERTCEKRENCRYYVDGFYARNISHIDDFEQIHNTPGKPCAYYYPREKEQQQRHSESDELPQW